MQKSTGIFPSVPVAFTGQSLVAHAGLRVLTGFVDAVGFGALCEDRLGRFVPAGATHRPGRLLGSLAAMLAAGGEHVSDLDILRASPGVFGQVPSNATISRFFERTVVNPELFSYGIETLTRELRSRAWNAAGSRNPALSATAADPLIIDLDATLVTSHSDKENVAGTYKGGYGFAPFIASCDYGTGTGPEKSSPSRCARATPERTAPMTTSASSTPPWPSCRTGSTTKPGRCPGRKSSSAPTVPGHRGSSSGTCTAWACSSPPATPFHSARRT